MKKLNSMKKNKVINSVYGCEFCGRKFIKETTVTTHICEFKNRYLEKDRQGNRLGFQAWVEFCKKTVSYKKEQTYLDFVKNSYYTPFVKFGNYCIDIGAINVKRFLDYLLKNQIKIYAWCSDQLYTKFLIEYLREEHHMDAINRSIETMTLVAEQDKILPNDCLRYSNRNKICYLITKGKISPWMLYQSKSGVKFLESLDETQVKMIVDYINPELWAIKFLKNTEEVKQVKELLNTAGY